MKRTIHVFESDLSGAPDANPVVIPGFAIDLTDAEKATLLDLLAPYLKNSTPPGAGAQPTVQPPRLTHREAQAERQKIRTWLRTNGYQVGDKGVIAAELLKAHRTGTPAACPDSGRVASAQAEAAHVDTATTHVDTATTEAYIAAPETPQKPVRARKAATPKVSTPEAKTAPRKSARALKAVPSVEFASPAKVATAVKTAAAQKTTARKVATAALSRKAAATTTGKAARKK